MKHALRVCMLTDAWGPIWGGGQEHIFHIASRLAEKECEVTVVVPNLALSMQSAKVKMQNGNAKFKIIKLGPEFTFPDLLGRIWFILSATRYVLRAEHDIYHSHSFSTNLLLPIVKIFRRGKFGFTLHGAGVKGLGAGIFNHFRIPEVLSYLFLYVAPYDFRLTAAESSIKPAARKKFVVVGNGVERREFSGLKRRPHKFFLVLCISRRDPVKGIEILEEAVRRVPGANLNLVSGRRRTRADFAKADLCVLPSLSEGLPVFLLEAMAAGLPVVVTGVGDCRQVVERAGCGFVVPPGDVAALAGAIAAVSNMPPRQREKMGKKGRELVGQQYTWEKVAEKTYAAYQEVFRG